MTDPGQEQRPPLRRRRWRWLILGGLVLGAGLLGREVLYVAAGENWHVVLPGQVYRSAQLSGPRLEEMAARHGIRTVVNLRGCCFPDPWYVAECRATHHAGVSLEDVSLSATRFPSRSELGRLIDVLDHADRPLLFHCRRGADRTGIAAVAVLLLEHGVSLAQARRQLGPRYGHCPWLHPGALDAFFDGYEHWLAAAGKDHAPDLFRDWVRHHYRAGACSACLEGYPRVLGPVATRQPQAVPVRVRNDSSEPWHFRPTDNAGVHLGFILYDGAGKKVVSGRAGLFDRVVAPGQAIDLTVPLPGIARAGTYRLFLDMLEEGPAYFYQFGSEPGECEVRVVD